MAYNNNNTNNTNNANMAAAIAASMKLSNNAYQSNVGNALIASSEQSDQDFLQDAVMTMTGFVGNPEARKKFLAIAGLDTAMKYGAAGNESRSLLDQLQADLYSDVPAKNVAAYRNAQAIVEPVMFDDVMLRLQEIHEDMTREETAAEVRRMNAARAEMARLSDMRRQEQEAQERSLQTARNAARNAFLRRFNKKTRRAGRKSARKSRRAGRSRRSRRSRRGGALGTIPPAAIVSVQQDPYSARVLVDTDTAEDIFESRGPYLL